MSCHCTGTPDTNSLQIGSAHKPEKALFRMGNFSVLAACSLILLDTSSDLMKCTGQSSRQTLDILVLCVTAKNHSVVLPDLGNQLWDMDSNDLERKLGFTEINGRSLFFFSKPGFIPGSCKGSVCSELFSYCQVLLDVGVGWMPVLPGIISVAVPRSREFISSKPLLLIFKGFFLG